MSKYELGIFEDDPRSQAGAEALSLLDVLENNSAELKSKDSSENIKTKHGLIPSESHWGLDPNSDPRTLATRATVRDERRFESYRQSGAWSMEAKKEYSPSDH